MPVFLAGLQFGSVVAKSLNVPFFRFSHQEGHLAAAAHRTPLDSACPFLAWHLSGGTCELLAVDRGQIAIIGGTKDISFGQLIDRVGVAMGNAFPCGMAMDQAALKLCSEKCAAASGRGSGKSPKNPLKPIPTDGFFFNVSGIETQAQRLLAAGDPDLSLALPLFLFQQISQCILTVSEGACRSLGISQVLFTGGVASSSYLRQDITENSGSLGFQAVFGQAALSSDNAVGISLLGGRALWR